MSPSAPARLGRLGLAALAAAALIGVAAAPAASASTASVAPAATADSAASCLRTLPVGTSTIAVESAGQSYSVRIHVPDAAADQALPLVLDLHGSNANGSVQAEISGLSAVADAEEFIVANPTGAIEFPRTLDEGNWAWNVPGVPLTSGTFPPEGSRDDVAFLSAVVETIEAQGCVDPGSVYATGFSGGGRMASALACTRADLFAAVAPVAGLRAGRADADDLTTIEAGSCTPSEPVAVVTFHGTADAVNPLAGNADPRWGFSVATAAAGWAELNGCAATSTDSAVNDEIVLHSYSSCDDDADVAFYEIAGGGHTWPGTSVDLEAGGLGVVNRSISASAIMWDFFAAHSRTEVVEPTPTPTPTAEPTAEPTPGPSTEPTAAPTTSPTAAPTTAPTAGPDTNADERDGSLAATGADATGPFLAALALLLAGAAASVVALRRRTTHRA